MIKNSSRLIVKLIQI